MSNNKTLSIGTWAQFKTEEQKNKNAISFKKISKEKLFLFIAGRETSHVSKKEKNKAFQAYGFNEKGKDLEFTIVNSDDLEFIPTPKFGEGIIAALLPNFEFEDVQAISGYVNFKRKVFNAGYKPQPINDSVKLMQDTIKVLTKS